MKENQQIYVYALKSLKDDRIYVGMTADVNKRLKEHNSGKTKSTKGFLPWILIFTEVCNDRQQAREREKYWKSGIGKEQLKKLK